MNQQSPVSIGPRLEGLQRTALVVAVLAALASLVGAVLDSEQFARSYLLAFVYWIGLPLSGLAFLMLHNLVGGRWSFLVRRQLEAASRTLWIFALLFIPLALMMESLYHHWMHPQAGDVVLQHKSAYLNVPFFLLRAAGYFLVWIGLAWLLNRWSARQESAPEQAGRLVSRMNALSGPGIVAYFATVTLAVVDWMMSTDPHWFSTIYGLIYIVGQALLAMAFLVLVTTQLAEQKPISRLASAERFHELGNFMLAFVMLWAYLSVSQLLIIWSANLPEVNPFYVVRFRTPWAEIGLFLLLFHFAIPFLLLLWRVTKRHPKLLLRVALALMGVRLVELFWVVMPSFDAQGPQWAWLWLTGSCWLAVGGLWVALFLRELKQRRLIPVHDPRLPEEFAQKEAFENVG